MTNRLREIRIQKGFSQSQLSYASRVPATSISKFETGWQKPWKKARHQLAIALDVAEDYLFPEFKIAPQSNKSEGALLPKSPHSH